MPRTTIDYSTFTDPKAKRAAAIKDIKFYLTTRKYNQITKEVKAAPMSRRSFIQQLSMFVGIDGYPAEAWADELELTDASVKEDK